MLKKIRTILAIVVMLLTTLLFLGVCWHINLWFGFVAKMQFLPAVLSCNLVVVFLLLLFTCLFGRMYCSVICPLGIMQDCFSWLHGKFKKNRFSYSPEKKWLRYSILVIFTVLVIVGVTPATTLLEPYSAYGRIVNSLFKPLYDMLNNLLASFEAKHNLYHFSDTEIWMRSVTTFVVAIVTLVVLAFLSWRHGRTYCNTICPVGTTLSLVSRFSIFRVQFNMDNCKQCGMCEKNCKASAIDFKNGLVDYSRCVVCGDCIAKCKFDALHYSVYKRKAAEVSARVAQTVDEGRRSFLVGAGLMTAAVATAQPKVKVDGGLAVIEDKVAPKRKTPITPPGSISAQNMKRHCTACQLCVSACPNNVLRPSTALDTFMQPVMSFERGYCRPECTHCSQVCPAGAIRCITVEEKTTVHAGHAVWLKENCVPLTDGVSCGNCARHCPVGAIQMVDYKGKQVPSINMEKCIGCGACEHLCPARPFSAIYVEGNVMHHLN